MVEFFLMFLLIIFFLINIIEYTPNKESKMLIVVDNMIANMKAELFIAGRKLNISLVFIAQSYFVVSKCNRLKSVHYFIMNFPNK